MRSPKFVLSKDKRGEFRFVLRGRNGKILMQSEGYKTKAKARNGICAIHYACWKMEDGVRESIEDLTL